MSEPEVCPSCGQSCERDSVDVGIGVIYGPWGCPCGWSSDPQYDQTNGPAATENGATTDPWGGVYPAGNPVPWQPGMAHGEAQWLYRAGVYPTSGEGSES